METPCRELLDSELTEDFEANIQIFRTILHADLNSDARFRRFDASNTPICAIYIEGMASETRISEFVLRACASNAVSGAGRVNAEQLMARVIEIAQCRLESCVRALINALVGGMTVVLVDGCAEALALETRGYPARAVGRAANESVVIGAQEGFVESLRTNLTLVRRYAPSSQLVTELITVGTDLPCNVALVYLHGTARPGIVDALRARIRRIDVPAVRGIGELQQLIEDRPYALLPQMLQTERPDRAASCLMDGQAVLLADNSPYALVAPVTVFHQLHASDDSFARWQYGSFLRLIRIAGMLLSVFLPGTYIALTKYHMHLIPLSLLSSIAEARVNVPFPVLTEILIMEFSFALINEAGIRIPQQIGPALGIVGALILGQAAVSASIVSPILVIIVALTGLGNFAIPDYGFGIGLMLYRLFVIFAGAAYGFFGICAAGFAILLSVCGMRSLDFPYTAPVAPPRPHNPDLLLRLPVWLQQRRMYAKARDGEERR